uniref:Uncharacterized protein n=2 Tax=unclassified Caudoviricetes TaxID=2788787 RepID=A0A8S5M340_9CAUD|nr:MAG TPA: hypothetical protein [Siphoviridae sp. ctQJR51]DAD76732.1 MAG TPA: hypothetical protein [Siphoviridae sp. ctQJR51]DAF96533.1 MAG TPA: hypothetical protein [Siphoviridae sp. ctHj524]DAF96564.1 MAG TPA: hypothetical protein [Siphoviridae sp. ctHj524]
MQEALPPAGVLGAAPLSLVPQHKYSSEPAQRCSRAISANQQRSQKVALLAVGSSLAVPQTEATRAGMGQKRRATEENRALTASPKPRRSEGAA